jgi:thioredoxin reductase
MHNVLTWEHRDSADFRSAARKDLLAHYDTISFEDDITIDSIEKIELEGGRAVFKAVDGKAGKEYWGRKVVLATGITDLMPEIKGYEECWVKGIFHCLFCHGYEDRGAKSAGLLGIDDCSPAPIALHMARYANRLAEKVTVYTNGNKAVTKAITTLFDGLSPSSKSAKNITVEARKIVRLRKLEKGAEVEVELEGGEKKLEGFLAHKPKGRVNGAFVEKLGLELTEGGDFKVTPPFNETSVKGIFAAGDCAGPIKAAALAAASGGVVVVGVTAQLHAED